MIVFDLKCAHAHVFEAWFGSTEDYLVTREFKRVSTPEQRLGVMRACFQVAAANDEISSPAVTSLSSPVMSTALLVAVIEPPAVAKLSSPTISTPGSPEISPPTMTLFWATG